MGIRGKKERKTYELSRGKGIEFEMIETKGIPRLRKKTRLRQGKIKILDKMKRNKEKKGKASEKERKKDANIKIWEKKRVGERNHKI